MSFNTVHTTIRDTEFFNSSRSVTGYDFIILYTWDRQWASNKRHTAMTNHIQATSICHYSSVTAFCNNEGLLILDFTSCKNAKHYCQILQNLSTMITIKYPDKLMDAIILLHDIAHSHAVHIVHNQQNIRQCKVLKHPAFSPGLLLCNLHIFGLFKEALDGCKFMLVTLCRRMWYSGLGMSPQNALQM